MVVWNRSRGTRSQPCFRFKPMGKVEKRILNAIERLSPARLFALHGEAQPKLWYETDFVEFDPNRVFVSSRWGKSKKRVLNAIGRPPSTCLFALPWTAQPKRWYEADFVDFDPKGVFSFRPHLESRKNAFSKRLDDLRQPAFLCCLEKPTQDCGIKQTSCNSIARLFFASSR